VVSHGHTRHRTTPFRPASSALADNSEALPRVVSTCDALVLLQLVTVECGCTPLERGACPRTQGSLGPVQTLVRWYGTGSKIAAKPAGVYERKRTCAHVMIRDPSIPQSPRAPTRPSHLHLELASGSES
jgi:hypothetical protein